MRILSKILQFSRQQEILRIKLSLILHGKGQKKIWTELPLLRQEPTINPYKQSLQFHFILSMATHLTNYNKFKIEDLTRLVFSYDIYETSLRRV